MENDQLRAMVGEVVSDVVREIVPGLVTAALRPLEERVGRVENAERNLFDRVTEIAKTQTEQARTQSELAKAFAQTTGVATTALKIANESRDENTKMLTSALEGHKKAVGDAIAETLKASRQSLVDNVERATEAAVEKKVAAAVGPVDARTQNIARELGVPDDPTPNSGEALTSGGIIKTQHRVTIVLVVQAIIAIGYVAKVFLDALHN